MTFLTTVLAESEANPLPLPTIVFGLIAFAIFLVLGGVVFTYRDVANRHGAQADAYAAKHSGSEHVGH